MFFQRIQQSLRKQQISEYIDSFLIRLKQNSNFKPAPRLAQIVTMSSISDGSYDFPCKFKQNVKKGAYIRLIQWELNFNSFEIFVREFQYLSAGGYEVNHGRKWDNQKLKLQSQSKTAALSRDFIIFHSPSSSIIETEIEPFNIETIKKILKQNIGCEKILKKKQTNIRQ